jgi:hypothetical protein
MNHEERNWSRLIVGCVIRIRSLSCCQNSCGAVETRRVHDPLSRAVEIRSCVLADSLMLFSVGPCSTRAGPGLAQHI